MLTFVCTNWHQSQYFDVDYTPVVMKHGLPVRKRASEVGKPVLVILGGTESRIPIGNVGYVVGKDTNEDWRLVWQLERWILRGVQRQFDEGLV